MKVINLHINGKVLGLISLSMMCSVLQGSGKVQSKILMEEICDNAIDDDLDGLIDLNDSDCTCDIIIPESLIPNPSFEEMDCCPMEHDNLNCASDWMQASVPTTDYLHTCGWSGWDEFPPPRPFPDGNGVMGFRDGSITDDNTFNPAWKEYAGACLLSPLEVGVEYRFEFYLGFVNPSNSPKIEITFFGAASCTNLPFTSVIESFGCPTDSPDWSRLGAVELEGEGWVKGRINITSLQEINAIAIGPPCTPSNGVSRTYYFFDNLILADLSSFGFSISGVNHPCSSDYTMEVPFEEDVDYQWYKEGAALLNENDPILSRNYGEGIYQVRVIQDGSCLITDDFEFKIPKTFNETSMILCDEDFLFFGNEILEESGNYLDTLQSINGCDSIVNLSLEILGQQADTITAKIFEGETYNGFGQNSFSSAGQYTTVLESSLGCDSLVFLDLEYYQIYAPNIFSPNDDGINDFFTLTGSDELIEINSLVIMDRWGNLVFEESNITGNEMNGWDGTANGEQVESGVYVFIAMIEMDDGIVRQIEGSVKLIY